MAWTREKECVTVGEIQGLVLKDATVDGVMAHPKQALTLKDHKASLADGMERRRTS